MITQERLKEVLEYNPETGDFLWKKARGGAMKGNIAGSKLHNGWGNVYLRIKVDSKMYLAHRLAFLYMTGEMPENGKQVDHIDGDGLNNSWENLRLVTSSGNSRNSKLRSSNKSGYSGVAWHKAAGKWVVNIGRKHYGLFPNINDAALMAASTYERLGYHRNHGSIR